MRFLAISCVGLCLLGTAGVTAQTVPTVTYDAFMRLDADQRPQTFTRLPSANRADLLRQQATRWRQIHAERLSPEQSQLLEDLAGFIKPELFDNRQHDTETVKAFLSFEERVSRAFTAEEASEIFTLRGFQLPQR